MFLKGMFLPSKFAYNARESSFGIFDKIEFPSKRKQKPDLIIVLDKLWGIMEERGAKKS